MYQQRTDQLGRISRNRPEYGDYRQFFEQTPLPGVGRFRPGQTQNIRAGGWNAEYQVRRCPATALYALCRAFPDFRAAVLSG